MFPYHGTRPFDRVCCSKKEAIIQGVNVSFSLRYPVGIYEKCHEGNQPWPMIMIILNDKAHWGEISLTSWYAAAVVLRPGVVTPSFCHFCVGKRNIYYSINASIARSIQDIIIISLIQDGTLSRQNNFVISWRFPMLKKRRVISEDRKRKLLLRPTDEPNFNASRDRDSARKVGPTRNFMKLVKNLLLRRWSVFAWWRCQCREEHISEKPFAA